MTTTIERYFGICQACLGEFHVRGGMVLHGYKRPGTGELQGDCAGVGFPPYERSCELQKALVQNWRAQIVSMTRRREAVVSPDFSEDLLAARRNEMITVSVGDIRWKLARDALIQKLGNRCRELGRSIDEFEKHIADWRPRPVRSFEEIQEQVKAQRQAAAGSRQRALEDKQKRMVGALQKRVDASLKGMGADFAKSAKKNELNALWMTTQYGVQNRLKMLYDLVTSGVTKLVWDGKYGDFAKAAEALGRPEVIRGLRLVDEHDVLRLIREPLRRGGERITLPEFEGDSVWRDDPRRLEPGPTHLRAREGMLAYFHQQAGKAYGHRTTRRF